MNRLFLCCFLALALTAMIPLNDLDTKVEIGKAAPNFTLKDELGKDISLASLKGKLVVLEWTNPGCPFVKGHYNTGNLPNIQKKYKDKNVQWLIVNSTNSDHGDYLKASDFKKQMDTWKASYSHLLLDDKGTVGKMYGAKTTPHLFIIDTKGNLGYAGALDDSPDTDGGKKAKVNYVSKALDELLANKSIVTSETKPYGCSIKY